MYSQEIELNLLFPHLSFCQCMQGTFLGCLFISRGELRAYARRYRYIIMKLLIKRPYGARLEKCAFWKKYAVQALVLVSSVSTYISANCEELIGGIQYSPDTLGSGALSYSKTTTINRVAPGSCSEQLFRTCIASKKGDEICKLSCVFWQFPHEYPRKGGVTVSWDFP